MLLELGNDTIHPGVCANKTTPFHQHYCCSFLPIKQFSWGQSSLEKICIIFLVPILYKRQDTSRKNVPLCLVEPKNEWTEEQECHRIESLCRMLKPPPMSHYTHTYTFFQFVFYLNWLVWMVKLDPIYFIYSWIFIYLYMYIWADLPKMTGLCIWI